MVDRFVATSWRRRPEDGAFEFAYACPKYGDFVERLTLPEAARAKPLGPTGARLASLLHGALGVSYYKAVAAPEIEINTLPPSPAAFAFLGSLYREGLGEFFVRNDLPYPPQQSFVFGGSHGSTIKLEDDGGDRRRGRAVMAFGGGKDSYVAIDVIEASGPQPELVTVALSDRVAKTIQATTTRPLTIIRRSLDPKLIEANRQGALNGHVPVTAINSLILLLYAYLIGAPRVVFANERSAEEATTQVGDYAVNHQFSKSLQAEKLLRAALVEAHVDVDYFSVLRPFSELWIARRLSGMADALRLFRSCNRNFVQADADAPARAWCGQCAKCAFTALITAPFLARGESEAVFGGDILDSPAAVDHIAATLGLGHVRPWDCVGGVMETAATLHHLASASRWADARVVKKLAPATVVRFGARELEQAWTDAFRCSGDHFLPADLMWLCDDEAA